LWFKSFSERILIVLLTGLILAEACSLVQADSQEVVVRVSTDKTTYAWGETVAIIVSVTNTGSSTLNFTFPTTHQAGFTIFLMHGQDLRLVWTTLNDFYYLLVTYLTLAPGETKDITFEWAQISETDVKIKPGTYVILGYLYESETQPWTWSERSEFDIRGHGYKEQ